MAGRDSKGGAVDPRLRISELLRRVRDGRDPRAARDELTGILYQTRAAVGLDVVALYLVPNLGQPLWTAGLLAASGIDGRPPDNAVLPLAPAAKVARAPRPARLLGPVAIDGWGLGDLVADPEGKEAVAVGLRANRAAVGALVAIRDGSTPLLPSVSEELLRLAGVVQAGLAPTETSGRMRHRPTRPDLHPGGRSADWSTAEHLAVASAPPPTAALAGQQTERLGRLDFAIKGAREGHYDLDFKGDTAFLSGALRAQLGRRGDDAVTTLAEARSILVSEDIATANAAIRAARPPNSFFETQCRFVLADGATRRGMLRGSVLRDQTGRAVRVSGAVQFSGSAEEAPAPRAVGGRDPLTDLPVRKVMLKRIQSAIDRSQRGEYEHAALVLVDLDRFKRFNEALGHEAGDSLLQGTVRRLRRCVRPGDALGRLHGDKFALLLEAVRSANDAEQLARRIHEELVVAIEVEGRDVVVSACVGIAVTSLGFAEAQELLDAADTALRRSREGGPGSTTVYRREMQTGAKALLDLEADVRRAVERRELSVEYEPVVRLVDGLLLGLRLRPTWDHPVRGSVPAEVFLPVAQDAGLELAVAWWQLRRACQDGRRWWASAAAGPEAEPPRPPLTVSCALTEAQLRRPDFAEALSSLLLETRLRPETLILELPESAWPEGEMGTDRIELLERIRAFGVKLVAGGGSAAGSLEAVARLPLDGLVLAPDLVRRVSEEPRARAIVRRLLELAEGLKVPVVARGIADLAVLETLQTLGCRAGQGPLLSEALSPGALGDLPVRRSLW